MQQRKMWCLIDHSVDEATQGNVLSCHGTIPEAEVALRMFYRKKLETKEGKRIRGLINRNCFESGIRYNHQGSRHRVRVKKMVWPPQSTNTRSKGKPNMQKRKRDHDEDEAKHNPLPVKKGTQNSQDGAEYENDAAEGIHFDRSFL